MIPHENEPDPGAPEADDVARHTSEPDRGIDAQTEILVSLFEEAYYFAGDNADAFLAEWRQRVQSALGYPCHVCGPMCICPNEGEPR